MLSGEPKQLACLQEMCVDGEDCAEHYKLCRNRKELCVVVEAVYFVNILRLEVFWLDPRTKVDHERGSVVRQGPVVALVKQMRVESLWCILAFQQLFIDLDAARWSNQIYFCQEIFVAEFFRTGLNFAALFVEFELLSGEILRERPCRIRGTKVVTVFHFFQLKIKILLLRS